MKVLEWIQTSCAALIIVFIFYVSWFDIYDWLFKGSDRKSPAKTPPAKTQSSPAP